MTKLVLLLVELPKHLSAGLIEIAGFPLTTSHLNHLSQISGLVSLYQLVWAHRLSRTYYSRNAFFDFPIAVQL